MIDYKNNESVTLSLERYEKLKTDADGRNWESVQKMREYQAAQEFLQRRGYIMCYKNYESPIEFLTKEEASEKGYAENMIGQMVESDKL